MCPGILPATGWMAQVTIVPSALNPSAISRGACRACTTAMAQPGTMVTGTAFFLDNTATPPATQIGGLSCLSSGCFAYACPAAIWSLPTAGSPSIVYSVAPLEKVFGLEKSSVIGVEIQATCLNEVGMESHAGRADEKPGMEFTARTLPRSGPIRMSRSRTCPDFPPGGIRHRSDDAWRAATKSSYWATVEGGAGAAGSFGRHRRRQTEAARWSEYGFCLSFPDSQWSCWPRFAVRHLLRRG